MSRLPDSSSLFPYCIQKIEVRFLGEGIKSKICAQLSVDKNVTHELRFIEKGQPLVWEGPLDGFTATDSLFSFQLYQPSPSGSRLEKVERHRLKFTASEISSDVRYPASIVIERVGELYSAWFTFLVNARGTVSCLPGTRVKIIAEVNEWITQQSTISRFLWIHGPTGIGKTAIAASVCDWLESRNMLEAGLFCRWDNPELSEPQGVISGITRGASKRPEDYARLLASAVAVTPDLRGLPVKALYKSLLEAPILKAGNSTLGLEARCIVVDALDECGTQVDRDMLLSCLYEMTQLVPWLKVIITSRIDKHIQGFLSGVPEGTAKIIEVDEREAKDDIQTFVRKHLGPDLPQHEQSGEQVLLRLVEESNGIFLWADVACRFLHDRLISWPELASLLNRLPATTSSSLCDTPLDQLYFALVSHSMTKVGDRSLDIFNMWLCLVTAAGSGLYDQLANDAIGLLLDWNLPVSKLHSFLWALSPVLYKPSPNNDAKAIRIISRSFFEYITNPTRSKELGLELTQTHSKLSSICLITMLSELRFNMCRLESSSRRNSDVPGFTTRVQVAIGSKLSYSCQRWIDHITLIDITHVDMSHLHRFLSGPTKFYWIEALSLLGRLDIVMSKLPKLMRWAWAQRSPELSDVLEFASGAFGLVSGYFDIISESTPHLYVTALAFAPTQLAIAQQAHKYFPNTLKLAQGASQHWPSFGGSQISCVVLSACQIMAASGSKDGSVRLWNAKTGELVREHCICHSDSVLCIALCPGGALLASGSHDHAIHIQNTVTGQSACSPLLGHSGPVLCVCFSADGLRLASGSHDKSIRIWDVEFGARLHAAFTGHTGPVLSIHFSPDNQSIVSASTDKTARVWNIATGDSVTLVGHTSWVQCVAFSSDSQHVVTGGYDRSVQVWDAKTGKRTCELIADHPGPIHYVAFTRGNRCIRSCSSDGSMWIWELAPGGGPSISHLDNGNELFPVVYLCDGIYLASGACVGALRLWSGESSAPASSSLVGHSNTVCSASFSPDGRCIVSGSYDRTVRLWDAETGTPLSAPFVGHSGLVWSIAFSPDGRRIASGSYDQTVRLWDAETGASVSAPLVGHSDPVWSVAFSPDGQHVASGSYDMTVRLWDAKTGTQASQPLVGHSGQVKSVAFSPNGRRIASGSYDRTVRLWETESGSLAAAPLVGHSGTVMSVAFSPDGRRIVSGSEDNTVRLWDSRIGTPMSAPLVGHSDSVWSVAFSPNGRCIASGSSDKTVRLWNARTGAPACAPLIGHSDGVLSVAFSPDSQRVVSGSEDGTIRIWAADLNSLALAIPTNTSRLGPFLQFGGWVSNVSVPGRPRLFWLPREYQRPKTEEHDDSLIKIGQRPDTKPRPSRVVIDYSRFVHGTAWTLVAGGLNRV